MVGDLGWLILALAAVGLEIRTLRRSRRADHDANRGSLGVVLARRRAGAVALFALWCFVGVHLFSRYGVRR